MATTKDAMTGINGTKKDFPFTFPYLKTSDLKVELFHSSGGRTELDSTKFTFSNATTISLSATSATDWQETTGAPKSGVTGNVYRETPSDSLVATFYPGSAIRSSDLNDNYTQNLYSTQESENDASDALDNSRVLESGAYVSAITKATNAVTTADAADAIADEAKLSTDRLVATTSDGGSTWTVAGNNTNASTDPKGVGWAITQGEAGKVSGDAAKLASDRLVATTSNGGTTWTVTGNNTNASTDPKGVGWAITQGEAGKVSGDAAKLASDRLVATTSDGGNTWTVAGNNTNASTDPKGVGYAITTAEAADAIADDAKLATDRLVATTSNGGTTWTLTGNNTNASTDPKGVGYAVTTAENAKNVADQAALDVADAVLYTTLADKAALEALTPTEDAYYQVSNSTGLANGTFTNGGVTYTVADIPTSYPNTQMDGITTKFSYTHSSKTYSYSTYFANDGDDRYMVGPASDGSNGQYLQTNGAGVKTWATVDTSSLAPKASPTFTGAVQGNATVTVGVDDTGYDVKFFGDTASAHCLWDASTDDLILAGDAGLVVPDGQLTLGSTAVTSTAAELNLVDGITAGTVTASKAVIVDASKDLTGLNDVTITGDLTGNVIGNVTGNVTGDTSGSSGSCTGNAATSTTATTATNVTVADESSDTSCNVLYTTAATGDLAPKSGTNLTFNSNTGELAATSFSGSGSSLTGISVPDKTTQFYSSTTNFTVPSGVTSIRAYAVGAGGDGGYQSFYPYSGYSCSGAGGGMAYGDIAVTPGQTLTCTISSGDATVAYGGTTLLTGNHGDDGIDYPTSSSLATGGTAVKHANVTNGGAYSGGAGGYSAYTPGGASAGSPLGTGISGCDTSGSGSGGAGIGGSQTVHTRHPGGGAGGQGSWDHNLSGGAGPLSKGRDGAEIAFYTDPLLKVCIAPGRESNDGSVHSGNFAWARIERYAPTGCGGIQGHYNTGNQDNHVGWNGGAFGGGGGCYNNQFATGGYRQWGGHGGFLGGGGGAGGPSGTNRGGDGGYGGGGGASIGSGTAQHAPGGGACIILIY